MQSNRPQIPKYVKRSAGCYESIENLAVDYRWSCWKDLYKQTKVIVETRGQEKDEVVEKFVNKWKAI